MARIVELLSKYKNKGVLIDSNLLPVYCVGQYDSAQLSRFKRTAAFTVDDFVLLARFLRSFDKIVTTPNILTEVNSLSNQLSERIKEAYFPVFAKQIAILEEHYLSSADIAHLAPFGRLGLTDLGIAELVRGQYLVISDDLKLVLHLERVGIDAINFNHVRNFGLN